MSEHEQLHPQASRELEDALAMKTKQLIAVAKLVGNPDIEVVSGTQAEATLGVPHEHKSRH